MDLEISGQEMISIQEDFIADHNFSGTARICIALTNSFHNNERFIQLKRDEYSLCLVVFFAKEPSPSEIPPLTYTGKRIKKTVSVFYEVIGKNDPQNNGY